MVFKRGSTALVDKRHCYNASTACELYDRYTHHSHHSQDSYALPTTSQSMSQHAAIVAASSVLLRKTLWFDNVMLGKHIIQRPDPPERLGLALLP